MSHRNDFREQFVSGHPGSKQHKGGRTNAQRDRDRNVRRRATIRARSATVQARNGLIYDEATQDD